MSLNPTTRVPGSHHRTLSAKLVGRSSELVVVQHALDAAQDGEGYCVVLGGEAGIGKSRIVAEAKAYATQSGYVVLQGNCFESDHMLPFGLLIDLLRAFCDAHTSDVLVSTFQTVASDVIKLVPEMEPILGPIVPTQVLEPMQEKRRLFNGLTKMLHTMRLAGTTSLVAGNSAPALIIFEDLHWCDETTLEFLPTFVLSIMACPVVLMLTYRSDEVSDSLQHLLARLQHTRLATEITLQRLDQDATRLLIGSIFEQAQPVRQEFVDAIFALTDGNPFFVEETLKSLLMSGDIYRVTGGWTRKQIHELNIPLTVQDAVTRRMQGLTADARKLLTFAAVAGRRFDIDLLAYVAHVDEPTLLAQVKELIAAQLVDEESADHFSFRHALTREVIYKGLLVRERKPLHDALAKAMEQYYVSKLDSHFGSLAGHFYQAGNWIKAIAYAQSAGERARALCASHVAIEHFTMAIDAARTAEMPAPVQLYRARAQLYSLTGAFELARIDYEHCLELARAAHDRQAEWQSLFDLGFFWNAREHALAGEYLQHALSLARTLNDKATLAHTLYRIGNWHANMDQTNEALCDQQEAVELFVQIGDKHGLAMTFDVLGMTYLLVGDMLAAAEYQARAIELFRELHDRNGLRSCLMVYAMRGPSYMSNASVCPVVPVEACLRDAQEALRLSRDQGSKPDEAGALGYCAMVLGAHGRYSDGVEFAQQALAIADEIEHLPWIFVGHMALGALYYDILLWEQAQEHLDQALQIGREVNALEFTATIAAFLAPLCIAQGELDRADGVLRGAEIAFAGRLTTNVQRRIAAARVEWYLARTEPRQALQLLDQIIMATPHAGSIPTALPECSRSKAGDSQRPSIIAIIPYLWRLRSEALVALGRWAEAEVDLRSALSAAEQLDLRPQSWRIHIALGKLLRRRRKTQAAWEEFNAAQTIITDLAGGVAEFNDIFLKRARSLIPSTSLTPLQQAKRTSSGLTTRERSIAILIAEGKNNRVIAETLVISPRTVEVHVSNIMNKLDVSSRVQIAAWTVQNDLLR